MSYTDQEIISGIKHGDRIVLNAFYKMHFEMIHHFIVMNDGDEQEAKDIYQEAVLVIYDKIKADALQLNCKLKTYIYSVCRNLWLKQLERKNKFVGKIEDSEEFIIQDENEVTDWDDQKLKYEKMHEAMEQLGEPCKTLINDFYIHDKNMSDISDKFGYNNTDTAKTQKYKCMNRLKKLFFSMYQIKNEE